MSRLTADEYREFKEAMAQEDDCEAREMINEVDLEMNRLRLKLDELHYKKCGLYMEILRDKPVGYRKMMHPEINRYFIGGFSALDRETKGKYARMFENGDNSALQLIKEEQKKKSEIIPHKDAMKVCY
jgi:hypothetical protein